MSADTTNDANSHVAVKATKLKASCDFCALSKIKCDRGQPQCQRCTKNGIMCHYSETRRIGKARQIYAASHTRPGSPTEVQGTWPPKKPSTPQVQQKPKNYATGGTRRPSNSKDQIHGQDRRESSDYVMPLAQFDDFLSQKPQSITASLGYTKPARSENMVNSFMGPGSPGGFLANLGDTADLETGDMNSMQDLDFDEERL
ncbi:transcription factor aflr [Aspergillus terreus]|uniref:Transcription factor aflr n=1 Tax=Aspergillus terreus TaxID=33178 RepID=A0A5M3ZHG7_ASPTE|nr:hypothetical protein ATETN484_0017007400 [Aspergillus terreus]GFF21745.1 transcription factor aflr [Aspergillus terreus]